MSALPLHVERLREQLGARLIETHISWVLLAGEDVYKLKKPLDLGFLDFSTLERRRFYCEEEVRLNRRLAPQTYLGVVAVVGDPKQPQLGGAGPALDWAVHMRAFPPEATLDRAERLTGEQIDAIADTVARFHAGVEQAPADSPYGTPERVMDPVRENFRQIRELRPSPPALTLLAAIERWSEAEGTRLEGHFRARKNAGWVRECHGDLHLGNIAWVDGRPLIFDCIEFNPALRFIDVASEMAFLTMDLMRRNHVDLAWRLLNRWLEHSGDYAGLDALAFYQVYRAMVRAKVDFIRAGQGDASAASVAMDYLEFAKRLTRPRRPALLLMHGVTGCGKTTLSQRILEHLGAVRLRSDVERKRLFGLGPLEDSSHIPGGIYTAEASRRTFARIEALSRRLLDAGFLVICDATFLRRQHREPLIRAAQALGVPWFILSLETDAAVLRERVERRAQARTDASEATLEVLDKQLQELEPFAPDEVAHVIVFNGNDHGTWPPAIATLAKRLESAA